MAEVKINAEGILPNSHKYRDDVRSRVNDNINSGKKEPKKMTPVIDKKSLATSNEPTIKNKIINSIVGDSVNDFWDWMLFDMIIPGCKDFIMDTIESALYGRSTRNRRNSDGYYGRTNYSSYYRSDSTRSRRRDPDRHDRYSRSRDNEKVDYKDIRLNNRADAEEIVDRMKDRINEYERASIADLLDLVGLPSKYTDNSWGWTDPRDIGIKRIGGYYLIDVRDAEYID